MRSHGDINPVGRPHGAAHSEPRGRGGRTSYLLGAGSANGLRRALYRRLALRTDGPITGRLGQAVGGGVWAGRQRTYLLRGDKCLCGGSGEDLHGGLFCAGSRRGRQQGRREAGFGLVEPGGRGAGGAVGGGALGEAAVQLGEAPLLQRSRQLCWGTHTLVQIPGSTVQKLQGSTVQKLHGSTVLKYRSHSSTVLKFRSYKEFHSS